MYIWGWEAMELYGTILGKRGSPWNIAEREIGKHGLHGGRFQKRYKARKRGEKGLGLWWVLVASTVFQLRLPVIQGAPGLTTLIAESFG